MNIIIDTREKMGFDLEFYGYDVIHRKLDTGDISIEGMEDFISIDRKKSISELASNLFEDYTRFKKEMIRAKEISHFFLLFEFPLEYLLIYPHGSGIPKRKWPYLRATPRKMLERIKLLYDAYGVRCIFSKDREDAEQKCVDILQMVINGGNLDNIEFFLPEIKDE